MKVPGTIKGQSRFAQVPRAEIPRSVFNRSHGVKTAFDSGYLIPVFVDEVLPGDTFNLRMTAFARLGTLVKPVMDNLYLDSFFFFVPYRLVWTNWEKFNGAQEDPGDSTSFTIPRMKTVDNSAWALGKLQDYMGLPLVARGTTDWRCSALPVRAYYRIWNEWFRDQNLQDSRNANGENGSLGFGDGPDTLISGGSIVARRGKRHDYFTSCLPWPQKGTAVELPLGTTAPVYVATATTAIGVGSSAAPGTPYLLNDAGASNIQRTATTGGTPMLASLENATAANINELRQAFQAQRMLERDARGGTRYVEIIKSHFGVVSPDQRLQRCEFLGGGTTMVNVSAVPQTSETAATDQANLAAYATAVASGHGFVKSFTEHGVIIGLVNVRADLTYQQGLERMWSRSTRYDFFWPALAMIGEQAVLNQEIYLQDAAADQNVFGYQERFAEYRYKPSRITGKMRSGVAGTLEVWHLAQQFGSLPTLGSTFIQDDPPLDRVLAAGATEPEVLLDAYFDFKCARAMPVFGVPGLIDHF